MIFSSAWRDLVGRRLLRAVLEAHHHKHLGTHRFLVELYGLLAAAIKDQVRLNFHGSSPFEAVYGFIRNNQAATSPASMLHLDMLGMALSECLSFPVSLSRRFQTASYPFHV